MNSLFCRLEFPVPRTGAGKEVVIGNGEVRARQRVRRSPRARPAGLYRQLHPRGCPDLPVGYSLGAGAFDVVAPYRAGYALEVGTASSVSAYGTLLLADFSPLALVTGVAHPVDNPLQQVVVFTNKAGRFGGS